MADPADDDAPELNEVMPGLCICGCGLQTKLASHTDASKGWVAGRPLKFRLGHVRPRLHPLGTKHYPYRTVNGSRRKEHLHRAEAALGKPLPAGAQVHHVDGTKHPRSPLVICQDDAYHKLLHARTRIVKAGGNPNTQRLCGVCGLQPVTEFGRAPRWALGVKHRCRRCTNAIARANRLRNRMQVDHHA